MSWNDVWKLVLAITSSVGGIGVIIISIVRFCSSIIADKISQKYELKMHQELEKYKAGIENKIYISKTRFDTEFSIYRDLSVTFFDMVKNIDAMIPVGLTQVPADEEKRKENDVCNYEKAYLSAEKAQDALNGNAPFISKEIYDDYNKILELCRRQLNVFKLRWNVLYSPDKGSKDLLKPEDYQRTLTIREAMKLLNNKVREYISMLEVIE